MEETKPFISLKVSSDGAYPVEDWAPQNSLEAFQGVLEVEALRRATVCFLQKKRALEQAMSQFPGKIEGDLCISVAPSPELVMEYFIELAREIVDLAPKLQVLNYKIDHHNAGV